MTNSSNLKMSARQNSTDLMNNNAKVNGTLVKDLGYDTYGTGGNLCLTAIETFSSDFILTLPPTRVTPPPTWKTAMVSRVKQSLREEKVKRLEVKQVAGSIRTQKYKNPDSNIYIVVGVTKVEEVSKQEARHQETTHETLRSHLGQLSH